MSASALKTELGSTRLMKRSALRFHPYSQCVMAPAGRGGRFSAGARANAGVDTPGGQRSIIGSRLPGRAENLQISPDPREPNRLHGDDGIIINLAIAHPNRLDPRTINRDDPVASTA